MQSQIGNGPELKFDSPELQRHRKMRALKDRIARYGIAAGGVSVIVAVTLIFFYLLYEVVPLFQPAEIERVNQYALPGDQGSETRLLSIEELGKVGMRMDQAGEVTFFRLSDGMEMRREKLPIPDGTTITSVNEGTIGAREVVAGLDTGAAIVFRHDYQVTYPTGRKRLITPELAYPEGADAIQLAPQGVGLRSVAYRSSDSVLLMVGAGEDNRLYGQLFEKEEDFLTGETTLSESRIVLPESTGDIASVQISPNTRWLYLGLQSGQIEMYDIRKRTQPRLIETVLATESGRRMRDFRFLLGGYALLVADDAGKVSQWFPVRDKANHYSLERIRQFEPAGNTIQALESEQRRKGFVALSADGHLSLFNTTANNEPLRTRLVSGEVSTLALAPRADFLIVETATDQILLFGLENEHPDVSFSALWDKVWYEGYSEPEYIWQSSAANSDFEPKYSLMPLAFGTLKAAFYAMLIAVPLAICGAIYTAHFMSPTVRRKVKPAIELMEALPTVILGFLAGLFFAPFMEEHLPGVFVVLVLLPIAIVVFGFIWANLPKSIRLRIPEGYDPVLLIPLVILVSWFSFEISSPIEIWLFDGDMRLWLTQDLGIDYSQRNSLVVGAAMGFAVIPTIFSITEDAIFSVPKHLSFGSLALGATPWQTLSRVVLPTASPGIFSAVMIGLGRAVGETMIVLMATGNTPIMDMNIFEGMRTLSANIAVEMPESEVGSTHYRILFLAGFVLFLFTFVVNTLAEFVRQRLRSKYSVI